MQAIDLILNGLEQIRENADIEEKYMEALDDNGEPIEIENDIEILNFYILPVEQQLKVQGKGLCEAIYGVKVRVNKEVRLWRAEGATFALGIAGNDDIGGITARKVKEGTEVDLTLFELFYQVCDIAHGLCVRVADSDEPAVFTMKQGRYAEGSKYPEMILRYADEGILERAIVELDIDDEGIMHAKDGESAVLPVVCAQTLLNEVYPNNMYNQCKNIEEYIEANKERFRVVMRGKAEQVVMEEVEELDDGEDIEIIKDEQEYFEYLYGNDEYEGIEESDEDKAEYVEIQENLRIEAENDGIGEEIAESGEDIEDDGVVEDGEIAEGDNVGEEVENEEIMTEEDSRSALMEQIKGMSLTGGVMSEEIGQELTEELLALVGSTKVSEEEIGYVIVQPRADEIMRGVVQAREERVREKKEMRRGQIDGEGVAELINRVNNGKMTVRDNIYMRKLLALAYRDEYREVVGGIR